VAAAGDTSKLDKDSIKSEVSAIAATLLKITHQWMEQGLWICRSWLAGDHCREFVRVNELATMVIAEPDVAKGTRETVIANN